MQICRFDIQNFRKLKQTRIELSDKTTVFVGANNSGKTSAMDALAKFLTSRKFVYNDITVINRSSIDEIGECWIKDSTLDINTQVTELERVFPVLDVWLNVSDSELQYVSNIIPTLDWNGGFLGVRFLYLPKDIQKLCNSYCEAYNAAKKTMSSSKGNSLVLWPTSLSDYLSRGELFDSQFTIKAYILDPQKMDNDLPQETDYMMECSNSNPLEGLIKIDFIGAQRGFSDTGTEKEIQESTNTQNLSSQLRYYYDKHLDPEREPSPEDLQTLTALEKAREAFDSTLKMKFSSAIAELEELGYPGVNDPKISILSKVCASETLKHDAAVQYALTSSPNANLMLPEKYNGLGYQNLISMVFLLMRFRDDWMRTGKAEHLQMDSKIEPLHVVLLEEPEAHLHVQVQQVFIKKAYEVLTNSDFIKKNAGFKTQLVISTHSSHIAKEVDFKNLRYFKRLCASKECIVPTSKVINLSNVFGNDDQTTRFITRYLQSTHCDLFFADAAILVEGSAEYMLVPHFIRNHFDKLNQRYISILEINGRHSQRLKPLIEKLCLPTLIITDLDTGEPTGHHKHTLPITGKGIISTNYAITKWLIQEKELDKLIELSDESKEKEFSTPYPFKMRIAFQTPVNILYNGKMEQAIASTFEDCIVYTNLALFTCAENADSKVITTIGECQKTGDANNEEESQNIKEGLITDIKRIVNNGLVFSELHKQIYELFRGDNVPKASFALDLIYSYNPSEIKVPDYIKDGLTWLQDLLETSD